MKLDAMEALANAVIGCAINWLVLFGVYGQPFTATGVMLAMIAITYARSFALRRLFRGMSDG